MKYVGSHEITKGATMKNTFEIQNSTADFSDYYSKSSISANTQSKMETIDFWRFQHDTKIRDIILRKKR